MKEDSTVRFGYAWVVARELNRVGEAIHAGAGIDSHVLFLKQLCRPIVNDWDEFQERFTKAGENADAGGDPKVRVRQARYEQLGLILGELSDQGVLIDHGIPYEDLKVLEME